MQLVSPEVYSALEIKFQACMNCAFFAACFEGSDCVDRLSKHDIPTHL